MPTNLEILQIMIDGGERLCDEAWLMWWSGKYSDMDEEIKVERLRWWKDAKHKVRVLAMEIKEWQKTKK